MKGLEKYDLYDTFTLLHEEDFENKIKFHLNFDIMGLLFKKNQRLGAPPKYEHIPTKFYSFLWNGTFLPTNQHILKKGCFMRSNIYTYIYIHLYKYV